MSMKFSFLIIILIMTGCSKKAQITSIDKDITSFHLNSISIALTLGSGVIPDDTSFTSQSTLQTEFKDALEKHLKKRGIYSTDATANAAEVDIKVNYERRLSWEDSALNQVNTPNQIRKLKTNQELLELKATGYTAKYAYLDNSALVNIEIMALQRDQNNESSDIELMSEKIVQNLAKTIQK
ncbi:hypothetical protein [Marinomonas transparens]|uniref:Lipoprotein n=1 Tax=Marinomonas transparens TaxID=2795388 RepID=A0A934N4J5_9GAMM|nr:hypothetical protein [Marinomonas transparens]MBJ7536066.1 hypothetical protein [Marinomonas transparens]